jgi:hypothetical protein
MNRAERRRAKAAQRRSVRRDLARFHACSWGVYETYTIRLVDVFSLMLRSARARVVQQAVDQWIRNFSNPTFCLNCNTHFATAIDPAAFMIVLPFADHGSALVAGVCEGCADGDLNDIALRCMRHLWPDLHALDEGSA